MEIIKLTIGENENLDIYFAEGFFSSNDEGFFVHAISTGEMTLLVKSDISVEEIHQSIQDDDAACDGCECSVNTWDVQNKTGTSGVVDLDLESVLAYCMESDLETYQCWRDDGNEGLYEASESDAGLAFVIVHDLLTNDGFPNVREMLEDDDELISLLDEMDFNCAEEI